MEYTEKPSFLIATLKRSIIIDTLVSGYNYVTSIGTVIITNCILREDSGYVLRENGDRFLREQ